MFDKIITPIVTPFHRDAQQSVNYEATGKLIDHLISGGVNGIFIFGSNGEFHVIEEQEKYDLTKYVVEHIGGKVPVYVGTGACATREAVRMSQKMEDLGADALSVIAPYYMKPSEDELYLHFKEIAESVKIPVILYNIPKLMGYNLSPAVVGRLAEIDNIKGIKDSSGDIENMQAYLDATKGKGMDLLVGSDSKISIAYEMGATGAIAGTSNVITEVLVELDKALRAGEKEKAAKLQADIDVLRAALKLGTVPSVLKRAVELAGIAEVGPARKPVVECSAAADEKIIEMLKYYHLA